VAGTPNAANKGIYLFYHGMEPEGQGLIKGMKKKKKAETVTVTATKEKPSWPPAHYGPCSLI
jgi:hypothetical protein